MSLRLSLPGLATGTLLAGWLAAVPTTAGDPSATPSKTALPPKNFTEKLPGGQVSFEMIFIPGGTYEMGSPDGEAGRQPTEGPRHTVTVKPFWLGKCEVSWDEYDTYWKDQTFPIFPKDPPYGKPDAVTRPTNAFVDETYNHGREGFPAICMSHHAAMMYCHWLRCVTKKGYRLPTEAEWEYACRAGGKGAYSFGDDPAQLGEYARFQENSKDEDHPKGTTGKCGERKPNAFGLHDMHGNVSEWVLDHFAAGFYTKCAAAKISLDPVNPPTEMKWGHVARGGSFKDPADKLRSSARVVSDKVWMKFDPQSPQSIWWLTKRDEIGFRVCLPVEELPALVGLKPMVEKKVEND
jgi:formylglycine-generating enzyme required for sulfatase activity